MDDCSKIVTLSANTSWYLYNFRQSTIKRLIGKEFKAYAVKPNGDTIPLIKIDDWNFRWQYFYTFEKMLKIPKNSDIIVEATFDNTKNNLDNPFDPPRKISEKIDWNGKGSMKTSDEMLQFIITYLPYKQNDENISLKP